jgi:OmpA-OmpF porin, OOP family
MQRSSQSSFTSQSSTTAKTRRLLWRDPPVWPFFWRGLLPLLGLLALMLYAWWPFARSEIEATVRERTRAALDAEGFSWVQLQVDGQNVMLTGIEPAPGTGDLAMQLARDAQCPSFFGWKTCHTSVTGNFASLGATAAAEPAASVEVSPSTPSVPEANAVGPDYAFTLRDGVLRLTGEMPSAELKAQVLRDAQALLNPPRVASIDDQLTVREQTALTDYAAIVTRGLNSVAACVDGVSSLTSLLFAVRCNVTQASEASIRANASAVLTPPFALGSIELLAAETVDQCEQAFASELQQAKIEFDIGKATIRASSDALLNRLADLVKGCPGTVRVEGHTDNTGAASYNQSLSEARAKAVTTALESRGVSAERLVAVGLGQTQPIAENTSNAGRARNRRIEFRIVTDIP